ncbi:hypothetical protein PQJ75_09285 [Rhodoplanes sp. TEM]|uniref:Adenylate cyclase n=1 Tax=Rhodoplanes tepidamans TaxID=200616 RepID=A0ABT5JDF1_RHOTP|nr:MULTISPECIES: hypothetical protein [Rhodoplanes]MDC7787488.1 hypothetical protein [Rhodoplanes tepidamans]MDC7983921.1 hypothetical protein [Rhodoplanes sp. TEM]MDQ0354360.1 TolB-like protein [Rhodoplanes tepidamans]
MRAALARITASQRFRDSPQIAAFLTYVVERTLAGKAEQIKGYTIAVEAFGRDASFDPNSQSIVRTEAARLRQELARYYAEPGRDDPIRIELPRGRYVPVFVRRAVPDCDVTPDRDAAAEPATAPVPPAPPAVVTPPPVSAPPAARRRFQIAPAWFVVLAFVGYGLFDAAVLHGWTPWRPTASSAGPAAGTARRHRDEPWITVAPVTTVGPGAGLSLSPAGLRHKLTDALSRFEDIVVVAAEPAAPETGLVDPAAGVDYVLVPTLVRLGDRTILRLRLLGLPNRLVVWADEFPVEAENDGPDGPFRRIVLEVTSALLQPFGVIPAAERRKRGDRPPAAYDCVLDAAEVARYFDPERRERTRACLEQAIQDDPGFAYGHVLLARLHFRDYVFGFAEADILERSLALTRRAVELAPTSARAHYTLMHIQVARGHVARGLAHGDTALELNPYDVRVLMQVGGQLVAAGQVERGLALLRQARRSTVSNPLPLTWSMFLAAFLTHDLAGMATSVDQMPGAYDFNALARALFLAASGDLASARAVLAPLKARRSPWTEQPRALFARFIPAPGIVERLADSLDRIMVEGAEETATIR